MAKDINIKVKTDGVEQAKSDFEKLNDELSLFNLNVDKEAQSAAQAARDQKDFAEHLEETAEAAKEAGEAVQDGGQKAADGVDNASQKAGILESFLSKVRNQALHMVTGFLGIGGVVKLIEHLKQLDEMVEKQKKLTEKSLGTAELGQAMESATGTVGKQDYWTKEVLNLQKAGGIKSPEMALELMMKANEYFKPQGGVQNPAVMAMLNRLAPKLGASSKSIPDIDAMFEKAVTEGVSPGTMESYLSQAIGISDAQSRAYMQTPLAKSRSSQADQSVKDKAAVPDAVAAWNRRRQEADAERERRESAGVNPPGLTDKAEMKKIAFETLARDLESAKKYATEEEQAEIDEMARRVREEFPANLELGKDRFNARSQQNTLRRALERTERQTINQNFDHSMHYYPIVGQDPYGRGARFDPNDL